MTLDLVIKDIWISLVQVIWDESAHELIGVEFYFYF